MKLAAFRIKNYKVIDDTGPVNVDPRVTALVGNNESGKSSVLMAMWKSRNVAGATFDKLYDFPRDRYVHDRKKTQPVTILHFALSPSESEEVVSHFARRPNHLPTAVVYTTSYLGDDNVASDVAFGGIEEEIPLGAEASQAIGAIVNAVTDAAGIEHAGAIHLAAKSAAENIAVNTPVWDPEVANALDAFNAALSGWLAADATRSTIAVDQRQTLAQLIDQAKQGNPWDGAREWAKRNLPTFIYFDDYGKLETRIHLPTYLRMKENPDVKTRTQTALFEWSGLDPQELLDLGRARAPNETEESVRRRHEKRHAVLDSASFGLTGSWSRWWTDRHHKLHFDVNGEDLVLRVSDEHNDFPIPFEECSHGFQWFFSFNLMFLAQSKKTYKDAILLLDEPGLHLHPTLQSKLIELFERISDGTQLLYSTHLPFLIDGNHLGRVRTVYLTGAEPKKSVVSNDVRPTGDRDTLFPLQAALSYAIAQNLFKGKRVVIVEDITDYWLIKALDRALVGNRDPDSLPNDTMLVPAGGLSGLMPLAAITLASIGVGDGRLSVLLDSNLAGRETAKKFADVFHDSASVLMLGVAVGLAEATVEDLVPRSVYLGALKKVGYNITLNGDENIAATNLAAMEMAFDRYNLGKFGATQRTAAALALIDDWGKNPETIPAYTKTKAQALFWAINKIFA